MVLFPLLALLLLSPPIDGDKTRRSRVFNETQVLRNPPGTQNKTPPPTYLQLPVFVDSRLPLVESRYFSPSRDTGLEPVPEAVREVLLPAGDVGHLGAATPGPPGVLAKVSCRKKKMLVQVPKSMLGTDFPGLRLGTCPASNTTDEFVYFEYELHLCGTTRTVINNQVVYSNILEYNPLGVHGPIRRAVPFTLPVACFFNRYQYSYKIGYIPKLLTSKTFKPMNRPKYTLTPRNAQWERLSSSESYMLGKPMYFQAEGPSVAPDKRLYVHLCYATPERSYNSTPQYPVVTKFGCMVESKTGRSRFIQYKNNVVRFSVDAFLFKGKTDQLYMHCTMSVGRTIPTATAKACNYDRNSERWVELYGSDSVCSCCDSNCGSSASGVTHMISSKPWMIQPKLKHMAAIKRKTVLRTTTEPKTAMEVTKRVTVSQPEMTALTLKGEVVDKVLKRRFEGDESVLKGSASVEVVVTEPHRGFDEAF